MEQWRMTWITANENLRTLRNPLWILRFILPQSTQWKPQRARRLLSRANTEVRSYAAYRTLCPGLKTDGWPLNAQSLFAKKYNVFLPDNRYKSVVSGRCRCVARDCDRKRVFRSFFLHSYSKGSALRRVRSAEINEWLEALNNWYGRLYDAGDRFR